jgi:hypothetical protein
VEEALDSAGPKVPLLSPTHLQLTTSRIANFPAPRRANAVRLRRAAERCHRGRGRPQDALIEMLAKLEIKKLPKKAVSLPKQVP